MNSFSLTVVNIPSFYDSSNSHHGSQSTTSDYFCVTHQLMQCSYYLAVINLFASSGISSLSKTLEDYINTLDRLKPGSTQKVKAVYVITKMNYGDCSELTLSSQEVSDRVQSLRSSDIVQNQQLTVFTDERSSCFERIRKHFRSVYDHDIKCDMYAESKFTLKDISDIATVVSDEDTIVSSSSSYTP